MVQDWLETSHVHRIHWMLTSGPDLRQGVLEAGGRQLHHKSERKRRTNAGIGRVVLNCPSPLSMAHAQHAAALLRENESLALKPASSPPMTWSIRPYCFASSGDMYLSLSVSSSICMPNLISESFS